MIIHEGCSADQMYSCALATARYAPCVPLVLWGMSAKMEKPRLVAESASGKSKELVGAMWLDTILPLCSARQFPSHTKFIIVESDHRFFESDIDALDCASRVLNSSDMTKQHLAKLPFYGREHADKLRSLPTVTSASVLPELLNVWTQAARITKPGKENVIPNGHGNLIWFSYRKNLNVGKKKVQHFDFHDVYQDKRPKSVGIGCYCIGLTSWAAGYMLQHLIVFLLCALHSLRQDAHMKWNWSKRITSLLSS